jgi:hypothetical protein
MPSSPSLAAAAKAFAAAAAITLGDASSASAAAATATAVDVPGQVFPASRTSPKPVTGSTLRPDASFQGRDWAVGRRFRVNLPVGARERLPIGVHIYSSEEVCHDAQDITDAAARREQDFIRGGDH